MDKEEVENGEAKKSLHVRPKPSREEIFFG